MGEEGTGKHPHKSSEEPYPHTRQSGEHGGGREHGDDRERGEHGGGGSDERGRSGEGGQSERDDLKSREYRGPDGEIHHHTHTYEEQHGGER